MTDLLGYLSLIPFALMGVGAMAAGILWVRLLSYRITQSHLELRLLGLPVRRVPLADISGAERYDERPQDWLPCLWFTFRTAWQPWVQGGFLGWERWGNSFCGPFVLIYRTHGRGIALTPRDPDAFIRDLWAARSR
ncbi:MAG: hypothetical protein M1582_01605 [Actinobacteria bacterium]|nr:hypothetical protein [Actinomycetota bacterium]